MWAGAGRAPRPTGPAAPCAPDARLVPGVRSGFARSVHARRPLDCGLPGCLARGNPFLAEERAEGTLDLPRGDAAGPTRAWVQLPPKYRKTRSPTGLVIALHGGPAQTLKDAETLAPQEFSYFASAAGQQAMILVAPAWTGDPTALVLEILRVASSRWNVDRNRVYLVGHSAGGVGSFMAGQ